MSRIKFWSLAALAATVLLLWLVASRADTSPEPEDRPEQSAGQTKTFDKTAYSLTDPASLWVVTNKKRPLDPASYTPSDLSTPDIPLRLSADSQEMRLRSEAARALELMADGAKKEGMQLMLASGFRSYSQQKQLYDYYVRHQGREVADTQSAMAGYSEHQTGLTADLEPVSRSCEVEKCFADTPEGKWLAANAARYGFIIRYPEGKQSETGYVYEPWHVRYVGKSLAQELAKTPGQTLESFFGLGGAPGY